MMEEEDEAARDIFNQEIEFIKQNFRGWIANMMQDFDAQHIPIGIEAFAIALYELTDELNDDLHADADTILSWLDLGNDEK